MITQKTALALQRQSNFPSRLILHHEIVSNVAKTLAEEINLLGVQVEVAKAELMAAIHDIGKTLVPEELSEKGSKHEALGVRVAEKLGLDPSTSKICTSHGSTTPEGLSKEEIVVRLADKLWKGKRDAEFERKVAEVFSQELKEAAWKTFLKLDLIFENIAARAADRLDRSQTCS